MKKLTIYLDNCCLNRPYDDQSFLSIFLETQAKLAIQQLVREGAILLAWSFMLDYENSENPDQTIKEEIQEWKKISAIMIKNTDSIIEEAHRINKYGFSKKDSLHLAAAKNSVVDYFITVDKGILKGAKLYGDTKIIDPIEFIAQMEG